MNEIAEITQWLAAARGGDKSALDRVLATLYRELPDLRLVAEDLGIITRQVDELREAFGIPGMRVLQFGFDGVADNPFLPHNHRHHSVVYTGTHDNDTVKGWFRDQGGGASTRNRRQIIKERDYALSYMNTKGKEIHWDLIRLAMQDVLGLGSEHRMNTPGTLGGRNWVWRFTWDMVGSEPGRVLGLITAGAGRGPFKLLKLPA